MKRFEKLYGVTLTKSKQREIILILMALEAIFAFSYLGYVELDVVSTSTLHILVIVGAMTLGISASVPIALVFALSSMWIGTYSTAPLDQLFSLLLVAFLLPLLCLAYQEYYSQSFQLTYSTYILINQENMST